MNRELVKFKAVAGQLDISGLDDVFALTEHLSEYALEPGIHSLEELAREELSVIVGDPDRDLLMRHLNMEAYGADLLWRDQGLFSDYGYGWLSTDTMTIDYGTHGMPDIGANEMFYNATRRGGIETMPDMPGLAVWKSGHIGVYIGNGEVIEAMGTKYGVVKTQLEGRGWTHWLEIPYINYA